MRIRLRGSLLIFLCLSLIATPTGAQSGAVARLNAPNSKAFPRISAFLDVHDAQGNFIHNLQADQVTILEGENQIPADSLTKLQPGVQAVVAINPGASFAIRNAQAISRYDLLKQALGDWAMGRQGSSIDDWSLLITGGAAISHTSDPAKWLSGLEADQVDARTAQPSLDTLARAVVLASDSTLRQGMTRAVLFITTPIEGQIDQPLKDIADLALGQGIVIHIWMVASSGALTTQSVQKLFTLASSTGGQTFTFTGDEAIPNPETILDPMRYIYQVGYTSKVTGSGQHQFSAKVRLGEEEVQSNTVTFEVDLQPPEPAFVSPPIVIDRQIPQQAQNTEESPGAKKQEPYELLAPSQLPLQVVFDFPDGRKREVVRSALVVDGVVVAQNLEPPFDQFVWNLADYTTSGVHKLQVQASDALGLTGASIEIPVEITVQRPEANPWFSMRRNLPLMLGIFVLLAGSLLFLVLVVGGFLRPVAQRAARSRRRSDPVTQPLNIEGEDALPHASGWASRFQRHQHQDTPSALAFLTPISEAGAAPESPPIAILTREARFGSDPDRATHILNDPCIDGYHACLTLRDDGTFWLTDAGSIAGTWVNFTPITSNGVKLEQGDMVNFGGMAFRFTMRQAAQSRKPVITLETPPGETTTGLDDPSKESTS